MNADSFVHIEAKSEAGQTVKKVFVAGLKEDITEEDIRQSERIVDVTHLTEKDTSKPRNGVGFVEFDDYDPVDSPQIKGKRVDVKQAVKDMADLVYDIDDNDELVAESVSNEETSENKQITDLLPGILNHLGSESLTHVEKSATNVPTVTSTPAMVDPPMKLRKSGNSYTEDKENCPPPSAARQLQPSPQKFGRYSVAQPVQSSNIAQYSVVQQSSVDGMGDPQNDGKSWQCDEEPNFTSAVLCNACGGIGHLTKDCQQRRPGASFVKLKETKPEVLDHEYEAFLSDMGIKYGGKKAPEEKKPYVPPMQGSSDASKGMRPTQRPLMLTNGNDAPGVASAHARAKSKGEEYQSSAMRVVGTSIFGGKLTTMTSGYKSQQELEYEREKKKRETENRPVPTEWKVQQLEKNLNANYEEYMAHLEQKRIEEIQKKQEIQKKLSMPPPPPPPAPVSNPGGVSSSKFKPLYDGEDDAPPPPPPPAPVAVATPAQPQNPDAPLTDRGGFRGGFGDRGRRGPRRVRAGREEWVPCTLFGRLVNDGKIKSLPELKSLAKLWSKPILELKEIIKFFRDRGMIMKANAEADSLQMANNINANLDTNSQDSSSSPTLEAAAGSAAGLLHQNHQAGQDNSSNHDGNIKNSGNGSDNITAENESDNATASNGPIKVKSQPSADGAKAATPKSPKKTPAKAATPKSARKSPAKAATPKITKATPAKATPAKATPAKAVTPKSTKKTPAKTATPKSAKKTPAKTVTPKSAKKTPAKAATPKAAAPKSTKKTPLKVRI